MPTYDYRCARCEHAFEEFQSIKDDPLTRCPECGKKALERLIGAGAGIIFKGAGFYVTDYKRGGAAAASSPAGASSSGDAAGSKPSGGNGPN
jgi:putative FmdB family regulatory protein